MMGLEKVPGRDTAYWLISYDGSGSERLERDGSASGRAVEDISRSDATDVVVLSHGWQGDVPAARRQYNDWISEMLDHEDRAAPLRRREDGFSAVIIGLHWPSKAWGDEELGSGGYGVSAEVSGVPAGPSAIDELSREGDEPLVPETLVAQFAKPLEDNERIRAAIRTLLEAAVLDPAPRRLSKETVAAYTELDDQLQSKADGNGAPPGDDRERFDAESMYQACRLAQSTSFGGASLGGLLAPLRVLTFWHMKRKANRFGESGAASLVDAIQDALPQVRIHLMGHSFGCIVAASALAGPRSRPRSEPVSSLTLMQGAMSLWSFSRSIPVDPGREGYFRRIIDDGLVSGPILSSQSYYDRAIRTFYSIAASMSKQVEYAAELPKYGGIGTWGIQGLEIAAEPRVLENGRKVDLRLVPGQVINLDATSVIAHGSGPSGAHSDICHPEVADAVWQAIVCGSLTS
jgi:pimeloyl-ACP methyl ester carboxylesterase